MINQWVGEWVVGGMGGLKTVLRLTYRNQKVQILINRLSQTRASFQKGKSSEEDIHKPDFHDLDLFSEKIQNAESSSQQHQQLQQHQQSLDSADNYLKPKYMPTRSLRSLEMTKKEESEFFCSPNRISAKITVDVTVEFERQNNLFQSKIDDTRPTNNGLWLFLASLWGLKSDITRLF